MPILSDLAFRIRTLIGRGRMQRELTEEMQFHLEMEARQLEAQGWPAAAAAGEARRRFGIVDREVQRARDSWGIGAWLDVGGDLRVALRQLRRRPLFTALGVGTLALGIGAAVALSSVAVGLLLRPLPVADEARLQVFWSDYNWRGVEFDFVKERQRAFSGLAAWSNEGYTLRVDDRSSTVLATVGSAELFDVLGAPPLLGRAFQPGDDRPGAAPIAVVSHGFWQQELGGDPHVIGRRIEIDGAPVEVVGVMPRGFYFPSPVFRIWRPLALDPSTSGGERHWVTIVGVAEETRLTRLTGANPLVLYVPLAQAEAPEGPVLVVQGAGAAPAVPAIRAAIHDLDDRIAVARVETLDAVVAAAVAEPLRLRFFLSLLGALALVIGAVGIYSVVSYSVVRRRSEFGVRLALGATPRRILADVIAGGLTPVVAGVAAGVGGALALASTIGSVLYGVRPADAPSLAGAAAALLAAGALAAAIPAVRAGRIDPASALRAE